MIVDVDRALRTTLENSLRGAVDGSGVEIAFDAPNKDWAGRRTSPTINLYLYDVREDLRARAVNQEGSMPRRYRLSYLASAWTQRPEDEHRLLDHVMGCFLRFDYLTVPDDPTGPEQQRAAGESASLRLPLSMGRPPEQERAISELWSALGGELKPSLDIVVTMPVPVPAAAPRDERHVATPLVVRAVMAPPDRTRPAVRVAEPAS